MNQRKGTPHTVGTLIGHRRGSHTGQAELIRGGSAERTRAEDIELPEASEHENKPFGEALHERVPVLVLQSEGAQEKREDNANDEAGDNTGQTHDEDGDDNGDKQQSSGKAGESTNTGTLGEPPVTVCGFNILSINVRHSILPPASSARAAAT